MNADQIRMTMKFMERVQLQGPEAPAYCTCMAALETELQAATKPTADPALKPPAKAPAVAPEM